MTLDHEIALATDAPMEAIKAWLDEVGGDATAEEFADAYIGEYDSLSDYAQELATECYSVSASASWPYTCIDWDAAADELSDDIWTADSDTGVYVFHY